MLRFAALAAVLTHALPQNDPHKFAGASGKTASAKASRVGPKAGGGGGARWRGFRGGAAADEAP
jgi:hypothetical protein